jgi:pimeloyl-ACP methyl ester carboxylesterase
VLEAPAAGVSAAWGDVQSRVSRTTRVCSYDRAGLGWSEVSDRPYDPGRVPEELRTLLGGAGERGPFVLVGHGLGAAFARMYSARPDADAAALVLIDTPVPQSSADDASITRVMNLSPWLARTGVLRAGKILSSRAEPLDGTAGGVLRAFLNRPDHLARASREVENWDLTMRMAESAELPEGMPVVTVRASGTDRVAFLTDPSEIDKTVAAIEETVALVRRHK